MRGNDRGFSIVELLVAIGVMAILLALALPGLSGARESARRSKCLTQLRNHYQLIAAYAMDNDDNIPFVWPADREAPDLPYEVPPNSPDWYLAATGLWQLRLLDSFGGDPLHESFFCASSPYLSEYEGAAEALGIERYKIRATIDYDLSSALFLDPHALDPARPERAVRFYIPRRISEVQFPSSKGFLKDTPVYHDAQWRRTGVSHFFTDKIAGFSDGSAEVLNTAELLPGLVMNPTGDPVRDRVRAETAKLDFTVWGVRGRDRE
jgi:prepilin-type N-terminal cleavage/methylation domain-containing protein